MEDEFQPETMTNLMIKNVDNWRLIATFINQLMITREKEERRR